jgi:hypothetical protein
MPIPRVLRTLSGYGIFDRGTMTFSRDGSHLLVSSAPLEEIATLERDPMPPVPVPSDKKVQAGLWRWRDDYVQPMQKARAGQERSRSYRTVYSLSDKKFAQLSDPSMAGLFPSDDGRVALGTDDRAYRHMVDYDGTYNDIYVVDRATGSRRPAVVPGPGAIPASHHSPAQPEGLQRPPATVLRSFPQRGVEPEWMARGIPYIDRGQEKERFNSAVNDSEEKKEVKK